MEDVENSETYDVVEERPVLSQELSKLAMTVIVTAGILLLAWLYSGFLGLFGFIILGFLAFVGLFILLPVVILSLVVKEKIAKRNGTQEAPPSPLRKYLFGALFVLGAYFILMLNGVYFF